MAQRIQYFDNIKAFAIFCVVWGHSVQYLSNNDYFSNTVFEFVYSFHMPLFMILSGFFFKSSLKLSFIELSIKKFQQLILPIIVWTIIICMFNIFVRWMIGESIIDFKLFVSNFISEYNKLFWFLKCLFFCYLISYVGLKIFKNESVACILTIFTFLFILPSPASAIRFLLPYFWVGVFLRKYLYLIERQSINIMILTFLAFVSMLCFWRGEYTIYKSPICKFVNFSHLSFCFDNWQITLFRFFIGLVGSIFFIVLIQNLSNKNSNKFNRLSVIGRYTMEIYILQFFVLERASAFLKLFPMNIWLYDFLFTPIITLIVIVICYFLAKIIRISKIINLSLLGKIYKV